MIDIHSHLLPGVDDGSRSIDQSLPVLRQFATDGVECVILTPHLVASQAHRAPHEKHLEILEALRAGAPSRPVLRLGWEIMLDEPNVDLRGSHLGLGGSRAILVEFPRTGVPQEASRELFRLRSGGSVPVLAHPERYWGCTVDKVAEWRAAGAVIQMDTAGLKGNGGVARISRALLEAGLVDIFASDNHGDARSLATARAWLLDVATQEHVDLLTRTNARRLLDNEEVVPVPPLPAKRGVFERLRELLSRR